VPLPGSVATTPVAVHSLHGPGLGVDGGRPLGLTVLDRGAEGAVVAWSQRRAHRSDEAPFERISRAWDGRTWAAARRSRAVVAWMGLDAHGTDWGLVPAVGDQSAVSVDADSSTPLPEALVLDRHGEPRPRALEAAALAPGPEGQGRLLARRLGADVEVLLDEGTGWRTLGSPTSLDHDRIRAVGAPAVATTPDGQVLVAWVVAGEVGPEGSVAAGVAARHWDGTTWHTLSPPEAPVLLDPWPAGPDRVSERTREDRSAQAAWKKRWGRRNATDWPGPLAVVLTGDGPVLSWSPTDGRRVLRHDGTRFTELPVPEGAVTELALGRRADGGLRIATVLDGALQVHDLMDGVLEARPGLSTTTASSPALDGDLIAWRERIPGGSAVRAARWASGWIGLGPALGPPRLQGPQPSRDRTALVGASDAPALLVGAADDRLEYWFLDASPWSLLPGPEAPGARGIRSAMLDGQLLAAWQDTRGRRPALHAARRETDGVESWSPLSGPGPDGAMLERPRKADAVLALGGSAASPTALVRDGGQVVGMQHRDGRWWTRVEGLPLDPSAVGTAGAVAPDGSALVASWIRGDGAVRLLVHRSTEAGWSTVPMPADCVPMLPGLVSLDVAAGPEDTWALAWRSHGPSGREAGPATVCTLRGDRWTLLPRAPTPRGGRVPRTTEPMPVDLGFAGTELLIAVRGVAPGGPATLASRWDGAAWQPLATTRTDQPTGPGGLLADAVGACLWWTAAGDTAPRVGVACARREPG